MANIIISPNKYVQGKGELGNIKNYVNGLGKNLFLLVSQSGLSRVKSIIEESFNGSGVIINFEVFNGECSDSEISRLQELFNEKSCDVVVGIGGGKILDTAKAVAHFEKSPVIIIPTIASTDAPCSALSVIYSDEGVFNRYLILPKNPDVVLVDTELVANAPARLLVSGMGDALATYFEARAAIKANAPNMTGAQSTLASLALAKLCYETLLADGLKAKLAVEGKSVTKSVENIVEANTLLSGLGFESGGLAAAHAIHNGFTVLDQCHHLYHGEKVAFGTIVQLVLENSTLDEIWEVIDFCRSVGLPTTLEELGIKEVVQEEIMEVAVAACAHGETIHNMPFKVTPDMVCGAILTANKLGQM